MQVELHRENMKKGDIIYVGFDVPDPIKKEYWDWRGRRPQNEYNGYAKVVVVRGDIVTLLPLTGAVPDIRAWIGHPFYKRIDELVTEDNHDG